MVLSHTARILSNNTEYEVRMSAAFVQEYHRYAVNCLETTIDNVREIGRILWRQQQCVLSRRHLFLEMFRAPMKDMPNDAASTGDVLFPIVHDNVFFVCLLTGCTVLTARELRQNCFALLTATATGSRLWLLRDMSLFLRAVRYAQKKENQRTRNAWPLYTWKSVTG